MYISFYTSIGFVPIGGAFDAMHEGCLSLFSRRFGLN